MKTLKIFIFLILIFGFVSFSYSSTCSKTYDEFVVQCEVPKHFFEQDFTCLNDDCSDVLRNNGYSLDLYIDEVIVTSILPDNVPVVELKNNLGVLNSICAEEFSEKSLEDIREKLETYDDLRWRYIGGEKLAILPDNEGNREKIVSKYSQNEKFLERCYNVVAQESSGWLIPVKTVRPYCEIKYNSGDDCFSTSLQYHKFLIYLIINPSFKSIAYLLTIIVLIASAVLVLDTLFHLFKNRIHKEFFKITGKKLKIFLIFILPYLYLLGLLLGYIVNTRLLTVLSAQVEVAIVVVAVLFLYFLVCVAVYWHEVYGIKRSVIKKLGRIK